MEENAHFAQPRILLNSQIFNASTTPAVIAGSGFILSYPSNITLLCDVANTGSITPCEPHIGIYDAVTNVLIKDFSFTTGAINVFSIQQTPKFILSANQRFILYLWRIGGSGAPLRVLAQHIQLLQR